MRYIPLYKNRLVFNNRTPDKNTHTPTKITYYIYLVKKCKKNFRDKKIFFFCILEHARDSLCHLADVIFNLKFCVD